MDPKIVDMNDGLFELLLVRKPRNPLELGDCIMALKNQDYNSPMLTLVSTPTILIETSEDLDWTLDGEYEKGKPFCTVSNLHSAVKLILH